MENEMINDLSNNENKGGLVHQQDMEFSILGIKTKWRGTVFFGVLALSIMLNVFLVFKVMSIQTQLYERVIETISPKVQKINDNVNEANNKIDNLNKREDVVEYGK